MIAGGFSPPVFRICFPDEFFLNSNQQDWVCVRVLMLAMLWFGGVEAAQQDDATRNIQIPDRQRQTELIRLVRQDCGSCHGLTLAGGLGPSLLPTSLRGKDSQYLKHTILFGRPGTPMPPWREFLTDDEAGWLVENLIKGFPDAP